MNSRALFLLLSTSFLSLQASAMDEERISGSSVSVSQHPICPELMQKKQSVLLITDRLSIRALAEPRGGCTGKKPLEGFQYSMEALKKDINLKKLGNSILFAYRCHNTGELLKSAFQQYINDMLSKDPYGLLINLSYSEIRNSLTNEQIDALKNLQETNILTSSYYRPLDCLNISSGNLKAAYIWAVDNNLNFGAQLALFTNLVQSDSSYLPQLLNLLDFDKGPAPLRAYGYALAGDIHMKKGVTITMGRKRTVTNYRVSGKGYFEKALNLLDRQNDPYRRIFSKRNTYFLSYPETCYFGLKQYDLIAVLKEEHQFGDASFAIDKVLFLANDAHKRGNIKEALGYFTDEAKPTIEYACLLYLDQRYDESFDALSNRHCFDEPYQTLSCAIHWKRGEREQFSKSLNWIANATYDEDILKNCLHPLHDEIMESDLSADIKAEFANFYNKSSTNGFELASQYAHMEDPILRLYIALPLFRENENVNDNTYDLVNNLLKDHADAPRRLLDTKSWLTGQLSHCLERIAAHFRTSADGERAKNLRQDVHNYSEALQKDKEEKKKAEEMKAKIHLNINFKSGDPRQSWKYSREAIENGTCNATKEHIDGYEAVGRFVNALVEARHISKLEAQNAMTVIRGYSVLHQHNADICRELLESPQLINYSNRHQVNRPKDIIIHPESKDTSIEMRAQIFYNILMAAFEFVRDSEDIALQVKFIREAFAPHIPCFEARSRHLDSWRESAAHGHYSELQDPRIIASKSAMDNISALANALFEKEKASIPSAQKDMRLQHTKAMFQRLLGHQSNKIALEEMNWAFGELQKRLHAEAESAYASGNTYSLVARQLVDQLVGKQASDKTIEFSDIETVITDILCWDVDESIFRAAKKRRVDE